MALLYICTEETSNKLSTGFQARSINQHSLFCFNYKSISAAFDKIYVRLSHNYIHWGRSVEVNEHSLYTLGSTQQMVSKD